MLLRANCVFTVLIVLNKLLTTSSDYIKHQQDLNVFICLYNYVSLVLLTEIILPHVILF